MLFEWPFHLDSSGQVVRSAFFLLPGLILLSMKGPSSFTRRREGGLQHLHYWDDFLSLLWWAWTPGVSRSSISKFASRFSAWKSSIHCDLDLDLQFNLMVSPPGNSAENEMPCFTGVLSGLTFLYFFLGKGFEKKEKRLNEHANWMRWKRSKISMEQSEDADMWWLTEIDHSFLILVQGVFLAPLTALQD